MTRVPGAAVLVIVAAAACSKPAVDPLQIERGMITVTNQTADSWRSVEIWINRTYRVTAATIEPGSRFQVPASSFVSGYGQRFDFDRMQLKDLRLTATAPDGRPVEHIMAFSQGGLEGAFGGRQ